MSQDPETTPEAEPTRPSADDSWQEVGRQFENLGSTLAQAFRTSWGRVETNAEAQQIKSGLESLLRDVSKAVEDAAATPEAQKLKEDAHRTAQSLVAASEQSIQEARPQMISALKQINDELQKLIAKMDAKG